jgi:hypothetical protein
MNTDSTHMNRLTLRFADAAMEAAFAEEQARKSLRPIRIGLVFAGALALAAWPAIIRIAPYVQGHMPRIVATILATLVVCFALTHTQVFLRRHQWMMLALACVMSIGIISLGQNYSPQILEARGFFPMVIHLFTIYGVFRLRFPAAVAGGWFALAMYLALLRRKNCRQPGLRAPPDTIRRRYCSPTSAASRRLHRRCRRTGWWRN